LRDDESAGNIDIEESSETGHWKFYGRVVLADANAADETPDGIS
jgi:hypothetical protein